MATKIGRPLLKLMLAATIRPSALWRGFNMLVFESAQLGAIQKELNAAVATRREPAISAPGYGSPAKLATVASVTFR